MARRGGLARIALLVAVVTVAVGAVALLRASRPRPRPSADPAPDELDAPEPTGGGQAPSAPTMPSSSQLR